MKSNSKDLFGTTDDSTDDSDGFSVSSTSEESVSQNEWTVERILAEAKVAGGQKYLIEWSDFPLCHATWEPAENLSAELLADWKATVEETGRTIVSGFRISDWRTEVEADIRAQYAKHEARNRKRALLGLKEKPAPCTLQEWLNSVQGPSENENYERPKKRARVLSDGATTTGGEATRDKSSAGLGSSRRLSGVHQQELQVSRIAKELKSTKGESVSSSNKTPSSAAGPLLLRAQNRKSTTSPSNLSETLRPGSSLAAQSEKCISKKSLPKASTNNIAGTTGVMSTLNVFIGGKQRKQRRNLLDAVAHPGELTKLFSFRKRWMVEKARRDKEGITPPPLPRPPLDLLPIRDRVSLDANRIPQDGGTNDVMRPRSEPSGLPKPSSLKKKRVRWADNPEDEDRQASLGPWEGLFVPDEEALPKEPKPERLSPQIGAEREALGSAELLSSDKSIPSSLPVSKVVTKICHFGPKPEISEMLGFLGWTMDDASPWSCHLQKQLHLPFSHLCTMQDLMSQAEHGKFDARTVCRGTIEAKDESTPLLECLAKRLRVGQLVAVCLLNGILTAIHAPEASPSGNTLSSESDSRRELMQLHYFIFLPDPPVSELMLAPLPTVANQERSLGVYRFFLGDTFEMLFRNDTSEGATLNFFLVFPQASYQEAVMMAQWLRWSSDGSCTIKTSLLPGQWSEFHLLDKGHVIFHEDAVSAIRSMPHLGSILHRHAGNVHFWTFSRSSSLLSKASDDTYAPVEYRLRPMLRSGTVFLVTPSFLVSQPEQAYNFIKFFWKKFTQHSPTFHLGKLAVASGMPFWLAELAMEKAESSPQFTNSDTCEKKRAKASEALRKCFKLLQQLVSETEDDENSPFIYAPDIIDGNDEQSLVNWFGSWTLSHNHQFRKFLVLGSSDQAGAQFSRNLQPVQFLSTTQNNVSSHNTSSESHVGSLQPQNSSDVARIRDVLMDSDRDFKLAPFNPIVLYKFPIFQNGSDTSQQQTKPGFGTDDFARWFTFFTDPFFARVHGIKSKGFVHQTKNTFVGFFYTAEHNQSPNPGTNPPQITHSPWIAIYRPSEIQVKPWRSMDLLIWDPNLAARVSGSEEAYEDDLLRSQRQLINLVVEKTRDSEIALPLEQVWLGPVDDQQDGSRATDVDRALSWIDELPTSFKQKLPITRSSLTSRGWKYLCPGSRPAARISSRRTSWDSPSSRSPPARAILQPPGATASGQPTVYRNHYQDAILGHRGPGPIPFTFQPTLHWYTPQLKLGLGFHHIAVLTWQSIFSRYRIRSSEDD